MANSEFRQVTRAELTCAEALWSRAYVVESMVQRASMMKRARAEHTRAWFVDGQMVAAGRLLPLQVHWNGRVVGLGGIASMATAPEHRRRGYTRKLVLAMLGELRRAGVALSGLYPFDSGYYHRYGWALASTPLTVRMPPAVLTRRQRSRGAVVCCDRSAIPQLQELHTAWAVRHNLTAVRDQWWFENYLLRDGVAPASSVYRYDAPGGTPEGYVIFRYRRPQYRERLRVRDFVYTSPRAREALLAFLGDQDSQATELELQLPAGDPLLAQTVQWQRCSIHLEDLTVSMMRIVDVRTALGGWFELSSDDGEVVFELADEHARWNHGRWAVRIAGGASKVSKTKRPADCALSVQTLSQLVVGFLAPAAAVDAGLISGRHPERAALLGRFAGDKVPFHNEYY